MSRKVNKLYSDPLELIWIQCANSIGIQVSRDDEVFASWDGKRVLRLGLESLDADDSVAQLVFHEICHALVEGPGSFSKPDWGLNDDQPAPRTHEFATLRLQAFLADKFGLRGFFAATTDFREYFDRIPVDSFAKMDLTGPAFTLIRNVSQLEDEKAVELASKARLEFENSPWRDSLMSALDSTRKIFDVVKDLAPTNSLWAKSR